MLAGLLALAALLRLFLATQYEPVMTHDSGTYVALARDIAQGDFLHYDGVRTPIYPLLLLLAGLSPSVIWLLQALLGLAVTAQVYYLVKQVTHSALLAFVAGLVPGLALNQALFEAAIMTETLSAFLVTSVLVVFYRCIRAQFSLGWLFALALLSGVTALTRPQFIALCPVVALLIALRAPRHWRRTVLYIAISAVPVLGWSAFNAATIGYFGVTSLSGYNLMNHATGFLHPAADQHAEVRDILLQHRARRIATTGHHSMTVFEAREQLMQATGLSHVELSKLLNRLALRTIAEQPLAYVASVGDAWKSFWAVPIYWFPQKIDSRLAAEALAAAWKVQRYLLLAVHALFLVVAPFFLLLFLRKGWAASDERLLQAAVLGFLLGVCTLQALVELGENPRYGVPTQHLAACFLVCAAASTISARRAGKPERYTVRPSAAPSQT